MLRFNILIESCIDLVKVDEKIHVLSSSFGIYRGMIIL